MKIWVVWPRKRNRKTHRGFYSKLDKIELCCESVFAGQFSICPHRENSPGLSRPLSNREFCLERNLKKMMSHFLFKENTTEKQYQDYLEPSRSLPGFSFPANPDTHK